MVGLVTKSGRRRAWGEIRGYDIVATTPINHAPWRMVRSGAPGRVAGRESTENRVQDYGKRGNLGAKFGCENTEKRGENASNFRNLARKMPPLAEGDALRARRGRKRSSEGKTRRHRAGGNKTPSRGKQDREPGKRAGERNTGRLRLPHVRAAPIPSPSRQAHPLAGDSGASPAKRLGVTFGCIF